MNGPGDLVGVEVIGIKIEIAIDAGEFQVGAGGLEGHAFADAGELDALLEFAVELGSAFDVGDGDFVEPAVDVDVAGDLFDFGGTFFEIQLYVAGDIFHGDIAMLGVDLYFSVAAGDADITPARSDLQRHLAGN